MTIEKSPAMPFYGKDFFDDERVKLMSSAGWGIYVALLWRQWSEGSIPADPKAMAVVIGRQEREVKSLWESEVQQFFSEISDGRFANKRLEQFRDQMRSVRKSRQQSGSKGGSKSKANIQARSSFGSAEANASDVDFDSDFDSSFSREHVFSEIWGVVLQRQIPDPSGKKAAKIHFFASVASEGDYERCRRALDNYCACDRVKRGFVQNASTWFNNWQDWENRPPLTRNGNGSSGMRLIRPGGDDE